MVAPELEIYEISGTGRDLFMQCVKKFDLPHKDIGTPLICMGDNYLIGWSEEEAKKFDSFVQPFLTSEVYLK